MNFNIGVFQKLSSCLWEGEMSVPTGGGGWISCNWVSTLHLTFIATLSFSSSVYFCCFRDV